MRHTLFPALLALSALAGPITGCAQELRKTVRDYVTAGA